MTGRECACMLTADQKTWLHFCVVLPLNQTIKENDTRGSFLKKYSRFEFFGLAYDLGTKFQAYISDYDYGATKRKNV